MSAGALVGAWRRAGLTVDGHRVADRCDVLWLQSADWYADIRLPAGAGAAAGGDGPRSSFARAWAFAGRARWDPPVMTWEHMLDSEPAPGTDANRLELRGDLVVECGEVWWHGRAVGFSEEWERISPPGAAVSTSIDLNRVEIVVGTHRIDVLDERPDGPFRARRHQRLGDDWSLVGTVGVPCPSSQQGAPP